MDVRESIYYRLNNDNMQEVTKHLNSMVNVQVAELEGCQPKDYEILVTLQGQHDSITLVYDDVVIFEYHEGVYYLSQIITNEFK